MVMPAIVAPPRSSARCGRRSALDRSGDHATDDVALRGQVEHDDRNHRQYQHTHHGSHVHGTVSAPQILDGDRDGLVPLQVEGEVGQQVVVPQPHHLEDPDGDHRRLHHRQDHPEEGLHRPASVDHRGFFQFGRDRLHEPGEDEDRQAGAEPQIDQPQAERVTEVQQVGEPREREHHHLEGDDEVEQERGVERPGEGVVHPDDPPGAHRGAQQDQRRRSDGDDQRPAERGEEVGRLDAAYVILPADERLLGRQDERIAGDEDLPLEGVDQHQHDGVDPGQRQQGEEPGPDPRTTCVVHALASRRRVYQFCSRVMVATMSRKMTALAWPTPSNPGRP
ncbi:hypothetical protein SDC9_99535 [bioreactor metagenome]|uniref:Uncharacterized protein n=1 Tax=bioreactor metagenome TaxID=1076179 RepID=A0A645AHT4_9ZZZZ